MKDETKSGIGESIVGTFIVLIMIAGFWAWNDDSTKKKQAELAAAKAQVAAVEQQKEDVRLAEVSRKGSLEICLIQADWDRDQFLKLNGRVNNKTNMVSAPIYVFQFAESKRANDVSACHIQWDH